MNLHKIRTTDPKQNLLDWCRAYFDGSWGWTLEGNEIFYTPGNGERRRLNPEEESSFTRFADRWVEAGRPGYTR